jgi:hypothetical protein
MGGQRGERDSDVGMDPAEETAGEPVPEHRFEELVPSIARSQPVSMRQEDSPSLDGEREGLVGERDVQLAAEIIPDPEIMISADIGDGEARATQLSELLQHGDVAFGYGVAVFEPEVEQVSGYVERGALGQHRVKELQEVALAVAIRVRGALTQMGVRDKIGASGLGHAASV